MAAAALQLEAAVPRRRQPVVLYHYPCPDGVFAALAAHLHFRQSGLDVRWVPNRVFAPATVAGLILEGSEHVYLLDFVGPPGFVHDICLHANRVTVLDHHKTAAESLAGAAAPNLDVTLDMDRSGATIARDHFKPPGLSDAQQELFAYIEDADLWRWRLPDSRCFHAAFGALGLEMDANANPAIFDQLLQLLPAELIARGHVEVEQQSQRVAAALKDSFEVRLGSADGAARGWGRCLAVRADSLPELRSQLGNALAEKSRAAGLRAIGVVAYHEPAMADTSIKVSLRSLGDEDTTVITQAYGGGGHRNASSCVVLAAEFECWKV